MDDIDIWRAAERTRKLHGADAAIRAAMRADAPWNATVLRLNYARKMKNGNAVN